MGKSFFELNTSDYGESTRVPEQRGQDDYSKTLLKKVQTVKDQSDLPFYLQDPPNNYKHDHILNRRLKGRLISESSIPLEAIYNEEIDKVRA
jgi:hypothetical protein